MVKIIIAALLAAAAVPSAAVTITFDDIANTVATPVSPPNVLYNGYLWSNFYVFDSAYFVSLPIGGPTGYGAGTISPNSVAYNFGGPATVHSTQDFYVNSGYFTGAWRDGLTVNIDGFNNGQLVFSQSLIVSSTTPSFVNFAHIAVDSVEFTSSGGIHNPLYRTGDGDNFALDNLTLSTVPEPASWAFMLAGFTLVGGALRRRASLQTA